MSNDPLHQLLAAFFELSPDASRDSMTQSQISKWDSFAMVQLIAELQSCFKVDFDVEEIDHLRSYAEIRESLTRKGVKI